MINATCSKFKLFAVVALLSTVVQASEHQAAYMDGTCYTGGTPKAPTPSPKQQDKDAKSAPSTPRPSK